MIWTDLSTYLHCGYALLLLLITGDAAVLRRTFWTVAVTSPPEQIDTTAVENLGPPVNDSLVTRQAVGQFTLMVEKRAKNLPRLIEVWNPPAWIYLSFDTPDRRVNVTLSDDGQSLRASARSAGCGVFVQYLQYREDGGEGQLYDAMSTALGLLMEYCPTSVASPKEVRRRFARASIDFPRAIRAMEARASELFSARARCRPPKVSEYMNHRRCG